MKETKGVYLAPDIILRAIINEKQNSIEQIMNQKNLEVVTSAFAFWEVLSCLTEKEIKKYADRIYKLLKTIPIVDFKKVTDKAEIEDQKRIKHLRQVALSTEERK